MLLFLLACGPTKPADDGWLDTSSAGRADDTGTGPEDTGDSDDTFVPDGVWEAPVLACPLERPRPVSVETLPPLWHLYGPDIIHFRTFWVYFSDYEEEWGCPTLTQEGDVEEWEGPCATDGVTWEGRWTHVDDYSDEEVEAYMLDQGEAVDFTDSWFLGREVRFDGISAYTRDAWSIEVIERDYRLDLSGYEDPVMNGTWDVRTYERWVPDTSYTMEGFYDVTPEDGDAGEYCIVAEAYAYPGCEGEAWGGWVLQGDATLVVTWDPDVACDGCGDATIDGVPVGQVCDDWFEWIAP